MTDAHGIARDQLRAFIERIERLEEEKKSIADDIKDVYGEAKGTGFDTKILREVIKIRKMDRDERAEREAILDTYLQALGMIEQPGFFDDEPRQPAPVDRKARAALRTSEAMDDNKAFSADLVAAGLISEEAHRENIALSDAVARKYGAGVIDLETGEILDEPRRSDSGLNIVTKHEDITAAPETATVPSSEQSEGNGSRDHQHVHSRQTDGAKHGGQDGEPAGADHASHLPETANETMGGTGDDCSFGNRGVWPPQGGASSSRGNDSLSVVTAGETATIPQSDDGAIAAVNGKAGLANADGVEPPSSGQVETPSNDDADHAAGANGGGDHVESIALRERDGTPTSNTGEGAACALPAKPKFVLRPYCRNPGETCGGSGTTHCHSCLKAREEVAA